MTTELSFLIDLLLNQKLPHALREIVANRVKEVELTLNDIRLGVHQVGIPRIGVGTSELPPGPGIQIIPGPPPVPLEQIAKTPEAAAALNDRARLIGAQMEGNFKAPMKTRQFK